MALICPQFLQRGCQHVDINSHILHQDHRRPPRSCRKRLLDAVHVLEIDHSEDAWKDGLHHLYRLKGLPATHEEVSYVGIQATTPEVVMVPPWYPPPHFVGRGVVLPYHAPLPRQSGVHYLSLHRGAQGLCELVASQVHRLLEGEAQVCAHLLRRQTVLLGEAVPVRQVAEALTITIVSGWTRRNESQVADLGRVGVVELPAPLLECRSRGTATPTRGQLGEQSPATLMLRSAHAMHEILHLSTIPRALLLLGLSPMPRALMLLLVTSNRCNTCIAVACLFQAFLDAGHVVGHNLVEVFHIVADAGRHIADHVRFLEAPTLENGRHYFTRVHNVLRHDKVIARYASLLKINLTVQIVRGGLKIRRVRRGVLRLTWLETLNELLECPCSSKGRRGWGSRRARRGPHILIRGLHSAAILRIL
mmetsp:Transcript_59819/g.135176  ORF Transcript_59819/g.135176 Transcript_59819/m.135176 type:complete len:420 (-) Transcript_59819:366-1625(-)